jgi:hypothetical protein
MGCQQRGQHRPRPPAEVDHGPDPLPAPGRVGGPDRGSLPVVQGWVLGRPCRRDPEGNGQGAKQRHRSEGSPDWRTTNQSEHIPIREVLSGRQMPDRTPRRPAFTLVKACAEPPAGIEPATPSLPSMRGWFATPCAALRSPATAQVGEAAKGWMVGRRAATRRAVSGKSLARNVHGCLSRERQRCCHRSYHKPQHLRRTALLGQLRVERRVSGESSSVWRAGLVAQSVVSGGVLELA